ncbi:DUF1515 family protein [Nitratireductor indicus]|uniref:DUF1515 family protein n=1 Tax=Nitratireductor indicus TaxID=721133 RepID=UPI002875893A|nr:DUF1515 family protein [Nitratireductor indicus]MDS1136001.1 DUF1515 family protein [Nitratireductor indicus]
MGERFGNSRYDASQREAHPWQILGELKGIDDRLKRADDSRAVVHRRLDEVSERLSHVEGEVEATKKTVNDMKPVTDDMAQLRTQPAGAGTLGRWLIRIGIGVVTPASWIDVGYTWLTGRPPP